MKGRGSYKWWQRRW